MRRQITTTSTRYLFVLFFIAATLAPVPLWAQESSEELAKELQNPVANLISVPLQLNWDTGIGPRNTSQYTLNVQPVIPISHNSDWNLITRTIMPVIYAESPMAGVSSTGGLGDIVQSFFFSPKSTVRGWIWGVGPVFLYPSATDTALGSGKWDAGPTGVLLKQEKGWTYGILGNQIWSLAGNEDRANVNKTFLQPFVLYTTKTFTTFGLNTESTYDWENSQWTVPVNVTVSQLLKIWGQPIQLQLGGRF